MDQSPLSCPNRARWYDNINGNWTSEDPIGFDGGDTNLQRYSANGPINGTDPTGHNIFIWFIPNYYDQTKRAAALDAQVLDSQMRHLLSSTNRFALADNLRHLKTQNAAQGGQDAGLMIETYAVAASAIAAGAAPSTPQPGLWTQTRQLTPARNAYRHFVDHGRDFQSLNASMYVRQATNFVRNPPSGMLPAELWSHFWPNCDGRHSGLFGASWPNCLEFWRGGRERTG